MAKKKKKKFRVTVVSKYLTQFEVEATSAEEAIDLLEYGEKEYEDTFYKDLGDKYEAEEM